MEHGNNRFLLITLFVSLVIILSPSVMGEQDTILLNGTGIFIESSQSWTFDQEYTLAVKGVSEDTGGVWVELVFDGDVVKDDILHEGQSISYSNGEYEIFNITMDRIYYGPDNALITFRPVYQYFDPALPDIPDEVIDKSSDPGTIAANNSSVSGGGNAAILPGFSAITVAVVIALLFAGNKWEF